MWPFLRARVHENASVVWNFLAVGYLAPPSWWCAKYLIARGSLENVNRCSVAMYRRIQTRPGRIWYTHGVVESHHEKAGFKPEHCMSMHSAPTWHESCLLFQHGSHRFMTSFPVTTRSEYPSTPNSEPCDIFLTTLPPH